MSKRERSFDFRTPVVDLTGKASKHISTNPSKEYSIFNKITVKKQPDSSRTLHPELIVSLLINKYIARSAFKEIQFIFYRTE